MEEPMTDVEKRADGGALLLTGATGFVGLEVLGRYVERGERTVFALVRAKDEVAAQRRVRDALTRFFGEPFGAERVVAVPGDLGEPGLGISEEYRGRIAAEVTDVIHSAATVSFELPLDESRATNVTGTERVLELVHEIEHLRGMTHVSTAYVAGTHRGRFGEEELDVGQQFRNGYERSKFEAEQLVRASGLPVRVVRPSIVVGEQSTGWTASFNVIYWPLRAFARSGYVALPARASAPVDVVPVDYVADAICALTDTAPPGGTFHLTAGPSASTVGEIVGLATKRFERPAPRLLHPQLYRRCVHPLLVAASRGGRKRKLQRSEAFFPYFSVQATYDNSRARRRLDAHGIAVAPFAHYFDRLVDFAELAEWGRRDVTRAQARPHSQERAAAA
jgi:long-chain acyl-CoA synthetase